MRSMALAVLAGALACSGAPTAKQKESAEIHTNLGVEALRAGRTQEALREFEDALKSDDGLAEAHLGRGLVMEFGYTRPDEAEREYRAAIERKPNLSEAHNNLGQLLARQGKLQAAVAEFEVALENMYYREPYVARCNKGQALYRLGRKEEGLADLQTCLAQNPRFCVGHREMGRIFLEEGKAKEARAALQKYTQFCDKEPDAWYQLGLAQLKLGEAEGAREAFGRCQELAGSSDLAAECRRNLQLLH